MSSFPQKRMRRLRGSAGVRQLFSETTVLPQHLVYPVFVAEDPADAGAVASMPGVRRRTLDQLEPEMEQVSSAGVPGVMLFGLPSAKDTRGSGAYAEDGIVPRAIRRIKGVFTDLCVVADVCLCQYTSHGHCGVLREDSIQNDATLELLGQAATVYAAAGADLVAPSAMMDGMVGAIRGRLDAAGYSDTGILSYAVKYASSFYGPFRDAAHCAPKSGDRRSHQMDPANRREALAEARLDIAEGADAIMVKPAGPYLDVIHTLRNTFEEIPLAAYQVSGEYSMIKAAAEKGWLDEKTVAQESLTAIRRAGADIIITYFAKDVAAWQRT